MLDTYKQKIKQAVMDVFQVDIEPSVSIPEEKFGDISTNVAMQLSKPLKQNPREIAEKLIEAFGKEEDFKACEIAGPGFINITMTDKALTDAIQAKPKGVLSGEKILVEYSDPNPFKPLHAGHLYTTLVGDVIARLLENAGAETIRLNYGGDVGLHVAKCMWAITKEVGDDVGKVKLIPESDRAVWMGQKYVQGNTAYAEDEKSKAEIIGINKKIYTIHKEDDHKSNIAQIYWLLRDNSYAFFKKLYDELQVHEFDRFIPESEVTKLGYDTVVEQLKAGVYEVSDGAVIFDGENHGLHKRVFINSEGIPTYEAKDVGLSLTKWLDYKFNKSIIITANEQSQYMQVVIKSIEQFAPEPANRTVHLTHGVLKLVGGEKMSSRKGNILSAFDILEAARAAGKQNKQAENEEVVLAAVKYALVKNRIGGDIIYDPQESIAMEGNSGPYLQYAHARARSILRKANSSIIALESSGYEDSERSLLRKLAYYETEISKATIEYAPHYICTYLYELAQTFNRFYEENKVIGDERQAIRQGLIYKYSDTLKGGLAVLGIHAPESM